MRPLLVVVLFLLLAPPVAAQNRDSIAVRQVLDSQMAAWNRADIEGFMAGYWHSPNLRFVSKRGVTMGWDQTLANYRRGYPDAAAMGNLQFNILNINVLNRRNAFVIGEWIVTANGTESRGFFTLLFKKIGSDWVIVVDHTS